MELPWVIGWRPLGKGGYGAGTVRLLLAAMCRALGAAVTPKSPCNARFQLAGLPFFHVRKNCGARGCFVDWKNFLA